MGNSSAKEGEGEYEDPNSLHFKTDSMKRPTTISRRLIRKNQYEVPDVETLRMPFHVCRKIFIQLPLADIHRCMLVCKEWRSLIDTCVFWCAYLDAHYDFGIREPPRKSALFEWKHRGRQCFRLQAHSNGDTYMFRPFPDLWYCNVMVPYAMAPPKGDIETYHNFIYALNWIDKLNMRLQYCHVSHMMVPCLLPWYRDRLPSSYEVLTLLRAHQDIIQHTQDAKPLNQQEMRNFYSLWAINAGQHGDAIPKDLYNWISHNAPDKCILFDGNVDICQPTPRFIITRLAPGWVGGLVYAVGR